MNTEIEVIHIYRPIVDICADFSYNHKMVERGSFTESQIAAKDSYNQLTDQEKNQLGAQAMGMFIRVSREWPANAELQGLSAAMYCKENNITDPLLLNECLQNDDKKIAQLLNVAKREHARNNINPSWLSDDRMRHVVDIVFRSAAIYSQKNFDEIEKQIKAIQSNGI